jgi:hypothetical protein
VGKKWSILRWVSLGRLSCGGGTSAGAVPVVVVVVVSDTDNNDIVGVVVGLRVAFLFFGRIIAIGGDGSRG